MHVEIFTLKIVHRYHLLSIPIMRKRLAFMAGLSDVPDMMRQVKFVFSGLYFSDSFSHR